MFGSDVGVLLTGMASTQCLMNAQPSTSTNLSGALLMKHGFDERCFVYMTGPQSPQAPGSAPA